MRDERLRRAARHATRSADPVERAAWLVERLRAGRLRPELVELAALAGDEAAGLARGAPVEPLDAPELVEALLVCAPRLAPRVALALFEWVGQVRYGHGVPHRETAAAAAECLRRPTARTAQAAVQAADRLPPDEVVLHQYARGFEWYYVPSDEGQAFVTVCGLAPYAARGAAHLALARRYGPPAPDALRGLGRIGDALGKPDAEELLAHLQATVVGLALAGDSASFVAR